MNKKILALAHKMGGSVWFSGYKCKVVGFFDGDGTPVPSFVQVRVAQKWWAWPAPPIEYTIHEPRWGELSPYVGK